MRSQVVQFVLWILVVAGSAQSATPFQALATTAIAQISAPGAAPEDVSAVFLSEEVIAVLMRSGVARTGISRLVLLRLDGAALRSIADTDKVNEGDELYAAGGNRVIMAARFHKYVYSPDLRNRQEIPFRVLSGMFPRSNVIGKAEQGKWEIYRLTSPLKLLNRGAGDLLSVSDDSILFRRANEVEIQTTEGRLLGSLSVKSETNGRQVADQPSGPSMRIAEIEIASGGQQEMPGPARQR